MRNTKGKSSMVREEVRRYPETDKWMASVVIEQGRLISKLEYKMTSYDPRTFRAFFEPVKTTKPTRLYASNSKRQRPQIISITLVEYNQGRITAEEQISLHPLSFCVNEPGTYCLFRDKSFWNMFVQISMEDHSCEFNRRRDPQRWVQPLGFEVEVIMDDYSDEKSPNVVVEEEFIENDEDDNEPKMRDIVNGGNNVVATPPPIARSTSSFPFHNRTFTEWCIHKPPKWQRKLKKLGCNIRNAFNRIL
ncbi:hypothetical protein C1645_730771 [Glomus cerebriforme]|uniref:Uncharacterized protein n=1 Tax=Glomus cerebriforme TaxID=658196 RepID=A0A397TNK8_9GLOM|nr:hypothetical protein C1645_730771 [Glomus cerebriforme]